LSRFQNTTTFKVNVTICDVDKSFSFDKTVEITSRVHFLIDMETYHG